MAPRAVELSAADGLTLRGLCWENGPSWALLVHDAGEDLDAWEDLPETLGGRGWSVLALDLRGHGGSDDPWDPDRADLDAEAAAVFARARGAGAVCAVAAGFAGLACLRTAARIEMNALVLLSPSPLDERGTDGLRGAGASKLIIVGSQDAKASADAEALARASIGWVLIVSLPTAERGIALLHGQHGVQAREQALAFLEEQGYLARSEAGETG